MWNAERLAPHHGWKKLLADLSSVGGLTALVKLAGAVKVVVSARYFGAGDALDAYLLAFLVTSFLADLLAGSITPALLPILAEVKEKDSITAVHHTYADALYKGLSVLSAAALVTAITSGPLLQALGASFSPPKLAVTRTLLLVMLPMVPLAAISAAWRALLYSECRFRIASIAPVATPLVTVAILYAYSGANIGLLAIATTLGYLAELSILAVALWQTATPLFPRWSRGVFEATKMRKQYLAVVGGTLVMSASTLVNQALAAQTGPGGVSTYNLGTRVVTMFLVVGPAALGTVLLPRLSTLAARGEWFTLRRRTETYLLGGVGAAIPVIGCIFWASSPLVHILFQSKQLSTDAATQISRIQQLSFLQLPFNVGLTVLFGLFAAIQANQILLRVSVASLLPTLSLSWLLARTHGILGLAIAPACAQAFVFASLALIGFKKIRELEAAGGLTLRVPVKDQQECLAAALAAEEPGRSI